MIRFFHSFRQQAQMARVFVVPNTTGDSLAYPLHRSLLPTSSTHFSSIFRNFQSIAFRRIGKPLFRANATSSEGNARGYRKLKNRPLTNLKRNKRKEVEFSVGICIEDGLPDDREILSIVELLRLDAPMAMKAALDGLKDSTRKTRDPTIKDIGGFQNIELSVMLCNDEFIRTLNKEWRNEDNATDVLSMSQHLPELKLPILMLGDVVISVETAARQAEERGHSLVDEIRILLVHGLLHLVGFDHEVSDEAEIEMEEEEGRLLKSLEWRGKGLIYSAQNIESNLDLRTQTLDDRKKEGSLRFYKPRFNYIFCDMDGTLLNSESKISPANARAIKEALSRGVKIIISTGKARPAAINILKTVDLVGKDGVVSEFSPGVFLQGLLVYGRNGQEIFKRDLDKEVCREAFEYSLKYKVPLIAFSEGRCFSLFDHPFVRSLHTKYHEAEAEIFPSVDHLLSVADIQKLLFFDTVEEVTNVIRPYWSEATRNRASVVQAVPDMLEIVPHGTSKGQGVKLLLQHLNATADEVMAIGDGENDVEMIELAALGIALSNGSEKTKSVADFIAPSNDDDGVADSIYRYAF